MIRRGGGERSFLKGSLVYFATAGNRAGIEAGTAGLRTNLYQQMFRGISEQARLANDLDCDAVRFTEQNSNIERFELSNNPVLLASRPSDQKSGFVGRERGATVHFG